MKRVAKFISDAGYCSRREADRYIAEGRVTINNVDAKTGDMVEEGDLVEVDGERVGRAAKRAVYIAFNKPVGVTCTTDREDKTNIIDFIGYKERIFPVGRLDKDSEGLIILTNDGDIVNRILRAGNNNPKEYIVTVNKPITPEFLKSMAGGVRILGVKTKPAKVGRRNDTTFTIQLTQGLNRQIRRMCDALDYRVKNLRRVRVLNIRLGELEPGRWRYFTAEEIAEMKRLLAGSSGEAAEFGGAGRSGESGAGDFGEPGAAASGGAAGGDGLSGEFGAATGGAGRSGAAEEFSGAGRSGESGRSSESGRANRPGGGKNRYAEYRKRAKTAGRNSAHGGVAGSGRAAGGGPATGGRSKAVKVRRK